MRIGIDVRLWNETGIGRYIRNLVQSLVEIDSKNQYVLFCRGEDLERIKYQLLSSKYGKNVVLIETSISWHSFKEQLAFPRILNKYNLDLVHFPYFSIPIFYNRPYVVTVHDLIINHFPTGRASTLPLPVYAVKRFGYEIILKKAIKNAKKIIVPSQATSDEIVDHYKVRKDKIVVTAEGVDREISDFAPILFEEKNPFFLYVGNAYPHKNLEKLLDAFLIFQSQNKTFSLKLAGKEDHFYKKLKKYVVKNNIKNIEFLGYVTDEKLSQLYAQASATFIPSVMEGFGLTALEAMKMGSLVACSSVPSLQEVCENNALYFEPTDVISIVHVMDEVCAISKTEKDRMINEGKKRCEKYSWKKTAQLTLDAYSSCL